MKLLSPALLFTLLCLFYEAEPFDAHVAHVKAIAQHILDSVTSKSFVPRPDLAFGGARPERSASFNSPSPDYSINYDVGQRGKCSRPKIPHCSFSSSVTIPEYYARLYPKALGPAVNTLYNKLQPLVGGTCASSIVGLVCNYATVPKCTSETEVKYEIPDFQEACLAAVGKCSTDIANRLGGKMCLGNSIASSPAFKTLENLNGKTYSLTKCRIPSISICENLLASPEWMASELEETTPPFISAVGQFGLDDDCKNQLFKFACTRPTCAGASLTGHRTEAECNIFMSCIPDKYREEVSSLLQCSIFTGLDKPSPYYNYAGNAQKPNAGIQHGDPGQGTNAGSKPWWIWLCVGIGSVAGCLIIAVGIVAFLRHRKRRSLQSFHHLKEEELKEPATGRQN